MTLVRHEPFADLTRQREAVRLGMIVFLASETMLFGALVIGLLALRMWTPTAFAATSVRLSLVAGACNTLVLLSSSLMVAIAVEARRTDRLRLASVLLTGAAALGFLFLAIKGWEYCADYLDGLMPNVGPRQSFDSAGMRMVMDGYFVATGLHALHLVAGTAWLGGCAWRLRGPSPPSEVAIGNLGLYWHLVDIVWVFLFPIFYLSR